MKHLLSILTICACVTMLHAQKNEQEVLKSIDAKYTEYSAIARKIWEFAEVGYQEVQSSALLQETLKNAGFKIESGVAGMPTAFVASYGQGKPVITILGEFDALPGVSQADVPEKQAVEGRPAGHACGHHLFGTASSAAAIAEKIQQTFPGMKPKLEMTNMIEPFFVREEGNGGSTDVGDVSWVVPTVGMGTATWVPGTAAHSWQAVAAGGTSIGYKGMMMAAKTLALTAMELYNNPKLIEDAWVELKRRQGGDFKYQALLGDRKPALDYRK